MHEFLVEKLREIYDDNTVNNILEGLSGKRKTTFRVNTLKSSISDIATYLENNHIFYNKSNILDNAFIIEDESYAFITESSIYKDGLIYLQSLSSMLSAYIVAPSEKENILDMCAAPGGKATLMAALSNNKSNITAIELHKDRYERLKYNIEKQGANIYALNINAIDLNDNLKFDKILLDAPCSGSGIINITDDKYKKSFTNELINKCVKTQKNLIKKASKILKTGGTLIYSTCSLLKEENEDAINFALNSGFKIDKIDIDSYISTTNIIKNDTYIKIIPNEIYEGFFIARLIKSS